MRQKGIDVSWLPITALKVDERTQRQAIRSRIKYLSDRFDTEKVNTPPLVVSLREDGSHYVIDGQHRVLAARATGHADLRVKCEVKHGLSLADEARTFLGANDSRAVSPVDKYNKGITARDATTLAIEAILSKHGLRVGHSGRDGCVTCVKVLYDLNEKDVLEEALGTSLAAWGTRDEALEAPILRGLGVFLGRFNGAADRPTLIRKLSKRAGGAAGVMADAKALSSIRKIPNGRAVAEVIRDSYNERKRTDALPPL